MLIRAETLFLIFLSYLIKIMWLFSYSASFSYFCTFTQHPEVELNTPLYLFYAIDSPEVNTLLDLVTLDASDTSGCFSVMAIEDNTVEGDEMVPLTLSVVNNTATLNGSQVLITVQDNLSTQGR